MSTAAPVPAAPRKYTPDDLLRLPDGGAGYELVNGELKERHVSKESSRVGGECYYHLSGYCRSHPVGWAFPPETGYQCFPDDAGRVRKADASFVSFRRMPVETYEDEGFCSAVPDLVVEVISPNDYAREVTEKRDEWLAAGVQTVWIVDPDTRSVYVHRADGSHTFLRAADTLTAPDLLPGFAVPVAELFRLPGAPA
jgi:Uma2 family endonuclease